MNPTAIAVTHSKPWLIHTGALALVMCVLIATSGCQKDPIAKALEDITSTDAEVRLYAATVLLDAPAMRVRGSAVESIKAALRNALKDEDSEVRRVVARGLIPWVEPDLVADASAAMVADLASEDATVRKGAVDVILAMPTAESTIGLKAALETDDPQVRLVAARVLERRGEQLSATDRVRLLLTLERIHAAASEGTADLPTVVAMLDEDPALRAAAAHAIAHIGDADAIARAVDRCIADLESPSASTRAGAARALSHVGDARALEALEDVASTDEDAIVRSNATVAIHVLGQDSASVIAALGSSEPGMRTAAIRAIGELNDNRAGVTSLVSTLASASGTEFEAEIVRSLQACGTTGVNPLIEAIGGASDRSARLRLARALNHPPIYDGMTQTQQFDLYNLQEAEEDTSVKTELAHILTALEEI